MTPIATRFVKGVQAMGPVSGQLHQQWVPGLPIARAFLVDSPQGGSEWTISVGDYVDNSFTALGSSDPREVRPEL